MNVEKHPLTSVEAVVKAFGGNTEMASRYGVRPSAVSNWKAANRFPPRLHRRIEKDAEEAGFEVAPEVFDGAPARAAPANGEAASQ